MSESNKTNKTVLNIYQKLAMIRKAVEVLQKNAAGYGYKYVSEDVILAKVTGIMDKHHLSLIPEIVPGTTVVMPYHYVETKVQKNGTPIEKQSNEVIVKADMVYRWVNNDNPTEQVVVPWTTVGQQADASQAFGSGLSYSSRYFLLKYFSCATTEDDPDNWRSRQQEARNAEELAVTKEIVAQINAKVTKYVDEHKDERDAVIETIKSIAVDKNGKATGNYNLIVDPQVASRLLEELNKKFFHEKEETEE